jgi:hypothetical protein
MRRVADIMVAVVVWLAHGALAMLSLAYLLASGEHLGPPARFRP